MAIKSKKVKLGARDRRKLRIRAKVAGTGQKPRLSVYRSARHTYAQLIDDVTGKTIASACTLESAVREKAGAVAKLYVAEDAEKKEKQDTGGLSKPRNAAKSTKSENAARAVGLILAERSKEKKIDAAVFDRNGFLYCGRISAVADGAREGGLKF